MFNEFKVIFLSIIIEALPFLLIGSIIASYIELFVGEDSIKKILPRNPFIQIVTASLLGLIFPICECTIIPIGRKLIQKSVPVSTAVVFMLATPIINPVPMLATYYAFGRNPGVMIHRAALSFIIALCVGMLHLYHQKEEVLLDETESRESEQHAHNRGKNLYENISLIVTQTWKEFLGVSFYLVAGSAIAAFITVSMPDQLLLYMQKNDAVSILSLEFLGYALSLCSHGDAFVAAGLANKFTFYPILAFLIISPMADVKNTIILFGLFKKKFSIQLIIKIFIVTFIVVYLFRSWNI